MQLKLPTESLAAIRGTIAFAIGIDGDGAAHRKNCGFRGKKARETNQGQAGQAENVAMKHRMFLSEKTKCPTKKSRSVTIFGFFRR
jgi:hypothetical protein